ncbi:MAG: formyltetrahydrofolate deformylase [Chloroflexi bacterium]|nr:formyltetrahydrofolate deformylase [Chloroflexota bacterium]
MSNPSVLKTRTRSAILLIHCPDRMGLVSMVTEFIFKNNGNILYLDQHVDPQAQTFFMRVEWDLHKFTIPDDKIGEFFGMLVADPLGMQWMLHFSDETPRMALFVSKLSHCLYDILAHVDSGEWRVQAPLIISNHTALQPVAQRMGIDFHVIPIDKENKAAQEQRQLALLQEHQIDFVVLARYMQIVSADFIAHYPHRIINIHHSFLPAFPGAKPYHSAHERGVKIIGATSHYVTADLDAGPIIEQDVVRVTHKDAVEDLLRKGQELEKIVLSRAIWSHLQRKILVYGNRTVIFP